MSNGTPGGGLPGGNQLDGKMLAGGVGKGGGHLGQGIQPLSPEAAPDIQTFLQTNKERIDCDPEGTPFDDLRHYAYEGDGNSQGSLSSLNSGTSDGECSNTFDFKLYKSSQNTIHSNSAI